MPLSNRSIYNFPNQIHLFLLKTTNIWNDWIAPLKLFTLKHEWHVGPFGHVMHNMCDAVTHEWHSRHKMPSTSRLASPRSAASPSSRSCRWSSPWSRCPPCWRRPRWRSCRRSGTGRRSCPRCCCRWSAAWTCSQSSGRQSPSGPASPARPPGLRLEPSAHSKQTQTQSWSSGCELGLVAITNCPFEFGTMWHHLTVEQGHCLQAGGNHLLCSSPVL